jgi:hypothetical protein
LVCFVIVPKINYSHFWCSNDDIAFIPCPLILH